CTTGPRLRTSATPAWLSGRRITTATFSPKFPIRRGAQTCRMTLLLLVAEAATIVSPSWWTTARCATDRNGLRLSPTGPDPSGKSSATSVSAWRCAFLTMGAPTWIKWCPCSVTLGEPTRPW
ncbi:unnamed protein product, partial [Ectocarpus sp. 12 AP-2014]